MKTFLNIIGCLFFFLMAGICYSEDDEELIIKLNPPDPVMAKAINEPWQIYLQGNIDRNAGKRLVEEIKANKIRDALVFLDSAGGNLLAGMELGQVIRKYGFTTYVSKEGKQKWGASPPGECYSACVLAYLGGIYRFNTESSRFGVHRFHSEKKTSVDLDVGQILSAGITNYLSEMGVDIALFDRMVHAGKDEIYVLNSPELLKLKVVNNGRLEPQWTIETLDGSLYLKGEQRTWVGQGKVLLSCPQKGPVTFIALYGPLDNADDIRSTAVDHSIRFGDTFLPFGKPKVPMGIQNNTINAMYDLPLEYIKKMSAAKSIGWAVSPHNPDIFYGFLVDVNDSRKISGFLQSCFK